MKSAGVGASRVCDILFFQSEAENEIRGGGVLGLMNLIVFGNSRKIRGVWYKSVFFSHFEKHDSIRKFMITYLLPVIENIM